MRNAFIDGLISSVIGIAGLFIFNYFDPGFERSYMNYMDLSYFAWFFIIEWRIQELG